MSEQDYEVRQAIGRLEGKLEMLVPLLQQVLTKQDKIEAFMSELHTDNKQTKSEVASLKKVLHEEVLPVIEDYKKKKLIGATLIGGSIVGGTSLGAFLAKIADYLSSSGGH